MTTTKEIEKMKLAVELAEDELRTYGTNNPAPKAPSALDHKCPKCKAEVNKLCVSFTGGSTSTHSGRIDLNAEAENEYRVARGKHSNDRNNLSINAKRLRDRLIAMEKEYKVQVATAKFLKAVKPANKKPTALVIEQSKYDGLTVIAARNLRGVVPGDVVPSLKAVDSLMKKGVDITLTSAIKEKSFPQGFGFWGPNYGPMRY